MPLMSLSLVPQSIDRRVPYAAVMGATIPPSRQLFVALVGYVQQAYRLSYDQAHHPSNMRTGGTCDSLGTTTKWTVGVIAAPREHATTRPSPQTPGFQGRASPFYDHPEVKGHELMVPYEYNGSFLGLVTLGNSRQPRNGDSIGTRREKHRAQAVDEMKSSTNTKHETRKSSKRGTSYTGRQAALKGGFRLG